MVGFETAGRAERGAYCANFIPTHTVDKKKLES
jgi:hypothetical protein